MFNRKLFKSNAKIMLNRYYWKAFLVVLIATGSVALISLLGIDYNPYYFMKYYSAAFGSLFGGDYEGAQQSMQMAVNSQLPTEFVVFMNAVNTAVSVIIAPVLAVSIARFFLYSRENKASLKEMFNPFKKNFGNNLGTILMKDIFIWLWSFVPLMITMFVFLVSLAISLSDVTDSDKSNAVIITIFIVYAVWLLSIIPVTVKKLQYSMLPYIMAENTRMTYKRAFQLTKAMTKGYKWKLFMLELSFIGWKILAVLVPFGVYFLAPYIYATYAETYTFLKARALESGVAVAADFPGLRDIPAAQPADALPVEQTEAAATDSAKPVAIEAEESAPELTAIPEKAEVLEINAVPELESVPEIESVPEVESASEVESVPVVEVALEADGISDIKSESELNTSETAE